MSRTLLVAGGSHSDIPVIQAARNHGYRVFTSGNNADDLGHRFSDAAYLEDFSDQEAMLSLAKRLNIDAICPSANDFSMISAAYVAEKLRLPGYDSLATTELLHHKDSFRKLATEIGLRHPVALSFGTAEVSLNDIAGLNFPLIAKPVDLTGGKGISRIDNPAQLAQAVHQAYEYSRAKRIVIEEFFSGTLHSCSSIIKNSCVIFEFSDNEFSYLNPYTVNTSTSPAEVNPEILVALRQNTEHLASILQLQDGVLHVQFLATKNDYRIIEYTRRPPGDLYAIPVKESTGVDYADLVVRPFLGLPVIAPSPAPQRAFYSRHCLMARHKGIFLDIETDREIRSNIRDQLLLVSKGQHIENYLNQRLGIFFLEYGSLAEMREKSPHINELIRCRMTNSERQDERCVTT